MVIMFSESLKSTLEKFVAGTTDSAISIVLVGSHALGIAHEESDIDLIVLTKQRKDVEIIHIIGKELNSSGPRPVIDCKVYTESEFSRARAGLDNRFLWTCLSNGKVLFGQDITKTVQLIPQRVSESYWKHIQDVEEGLRNLDVGVQYTGSCYSIYDALSTTYFVERFILHSIKGNMNKEEFIKMQLQTEYSKARERYYWVISHIEKANSERKLRIPAGVDRRFNRSDYKLMHSKVVDFLEILQNRYKNIKNWSE